MSLADGTVFGSMNTCLDEIDDDKGKKSDVQDSGDEREVDMKSMSDSFLCATEDEEEEEEGHKIQLGPQYTLKEQIEKDKDDESLRRWKEQLLGSVDIKNFGDVLDPAVKILTLSIISPGRPDIVLPIPEDGNPKGLWFTLKEGSHYSLQFSFQVSNNIVSGLKYTNAVWKTVDSTKEMLGTFSPQQEPYNCGIPEETVPLGILARGGYCAKTKFVNDDKRCHLEINYTFHIRKDWATTP